MSIHFISGKPGGGKSLYATKLCFEELRYGTRHIVTNLALKVGELNAYYQKHYDDPVNLRRVRCPWFLNWLFWLLPDWMAFKVFPVSDVIAETRLKQPRQDDICSRITIITDEDLPAFFTHRPTCKIESIPNVEWKRGVRPDYSVVNDAGIFFCLDEIHIAFNSRAWADTGAEVLYYLSQHRKLGDDVICITQSVANVDKQFRSVAQDFTYIRNLGKEKLGKFRLPARFVRKTYSQPPAGDKSEPMDIATFSLDLDGIAQCYDTAKGVGIHGRAGADTNERKNGIHWLWFAIGLPVLLILLVKYLPTLIVKGINHGNLPIKAAQGKNLPAALPVTAFVSTVTVPVAGSNAVATVPVATVNLLPPVTCSGWCKAGNDYFVFTDDGETYTSGSGEIDWIKKRAVSCLGHIYKIKARPATTDYREPNDNPAPSPALVHAAAPDANPVDVIYIGQRPPERVPPPASGFAAATHGSPASQGVPPRDFLPQ